MTDTNKMRKLLAAATPVPWYGRWSISTADGDPIASTDVSLAGDPEESDANGDLIVAAVNGLPAMLDELDGLRAELRRMSEWHDEIADTLRAEVERLRADLREAMELLRTHGQPPDWMRQHPARCDSWERRYGALLAKHKETP